MDEQATMSLTDRVQKALDTIRPAVRMDGGDIDLVEVTPEGVVKVKLRGSCSGCPSSAMTLAMGVERRVKSLVPEITAVATV